MSDKNMSVSSVNSRQQTRQRRGHPGLPMIGIQWHLTAHCDQHCKHCYMYESDSYRQELENELSFENCVKIIDDIYRTMKRWGVNAGLALTGGDPLLREDLFDILKYIQGKKDIFFEVLMMGNPFHLSLEVARELKKHGVIHYQISIDGMEETHDGLRSKGSFNESVEGIRRLKTAGLSAGVMFTLSNLNKDDLLDVMRLANEENVDRFAFDRVVPVGAGEKLKDDLVENRELKELMQEYMREKLKMNFANKEGFKSNLFKIFLHENNLLHIPEGKDTFTEGCLIGKSLCILADGRVLPCRRLPIEIGKFPEQTFTDVFINSPLLNKFRDIDNFKKCKHCELGAVCRGCPAVTYGVTGNPFAPDPNCWKTFKKN